MEGSKFKFSVIIPIYNVEEYLEQTIESIINQTIGFENNIQLILVNDGSPDDSEQICKKYEKLYPNNVVYIKQKNGGVSSARNEGIKHVKGEFVNFFDGDDVWSNDVFTEVYKAYKKHPDISLFSCRMVFFDAIKGKHALNYKYLKDKVVDINEDYDFIQLSSCSILIKTSILKGHLYDSSIKYSEDNKFINEIILEQGKYMVLSKPTYYYRRRINASSAIQSQTSDNDYYMVTPFKVYDYLAELSIKKFGEVIPYIQYLIMYEINWRIKSIPENLSKDDKNKYNKIVLKLLNYVDDSFIMTLKNSDLSKKVFIYNLKHKNDCIKDIYFEDNKLKLYEYETPIRNLGFLIIDSVYFRRSTMIAYGKLDTRFVSKKDFKVLVNNESHKVEYYDLTNDYNEETFNGDHLHNYIGVKITFKVEPSQVINFKYKDINILPRFKRISVFSDKLPRSYHRYNNCIIFYDKRNLHIIKDSLFKRIYFEFRNIFFLLTRKKLKSAFIRLYISFAKLFKKKKIMLISDRIDKADENGEHFFKYMLKNHPEYKCYYILSNKCNDWERVKKIGSTLSNDSFKYKRLFQIADYIVSSQAENYVFNVLGKGNVYVQDKYYFKYVFLQHGIIKDDLSPWLNVNTKKMDMFVTSSQQEYDSLLKYNYYYGKDIVKLTGLPRYDSLIKKSKEYPVKKQILLSCTWRTSLASKINPKNGERIYNDKFKESNYFKFLNNLINDNRLLNALKETGYKIKFFPHPNVLVQLEDFDFNDCIEVDTSNMDYQREFCENALMITDYSSVFFDFGYLKKPIIYIQHDKEEFFAGQLYNEGYFDYNTMGFGPVCTDIESTVDTIIKFIKDDCKIENKYIKRINKFYKYHDDKNCERVFKEIEKL